jgi:hypothetical protein
MLYKCEVCGYETNRLLNYKRHETRQTPCTSKHKGHISRIGYINTINVDGTNINVDGTNINVDGTNINVDGTNINVDGTNINVDGTNINVDGNVNIYECFKCEKRFKCKKGLIGHQKKCDGLDKRQCKVCLKLFKTSQGKFQHIKYVKCVPPTTINNIHNDNSTYNNTINNNQQYITNNIRLCFGNENLDRLCDEEGYMKRIEQYMKMLKYALPKALEDVYFNDAYPENQTIKKERRNDALVSIHVGENRWEKRYAKDMITKTIETIHDYMDKYVREVKPNNKMNRELKAFGNEMSKLKYWNTEAIEDKLELNEYYESSDEVMKQEEKSVTRLLTNMMYEKTNTA